MRVSDENRVLYKFFGQRFSIYSLVCKSQKDNGLGHTDDICTAISKGGQGIEEIARVFKEEIGPSISSFNKTFPEVVALSAQNFTNVVALSAQNFTNVVATSAHKFTDVMARSAYVFLSLMTLAIFKYLFPGLWSFVWNTHPLFGLITAIGCAGAYSVRNSIGSVVNKRKTSVKQDAGN
jgi:hypothetical protein